MGTRHVALITFTSASECHGYIDGWFGGPWKFEGVKISHGTDVPAKKCKMKYELDKKHWDEYRADYFDTCNPDRWYWCEEDEDEDEDCSVKEEGDESMEEVTIEPAQAENIGSSQARGRPLSRKL